MFHDMIWTKPSKSKRVISPHKETSVGLPALAGKSSLATDKYVCELLGGKSAFSSSLSHGEETSKHEQKIPLMTPQEIRGMDDTILIFHPDLRYSIKAKRMPEFVKPEKGTIVPDYPQLPVRPEIPLLPAPRLDTWRRASEAYPLFFADGEMSDGTTLGL